MAITDPQSHTGCRTWRCFWFFVVQRDAVCLVRGFLAQHHGRVLKLLINRRPFFRAAKQQPAEVLAKCDLCYTSPCENGGFCEALPDRQFRCKCTPGYHGDRCQHKIDACYGNPCRNSGTCKVLEEGRFRYLLNATVLIRVVARRADFRVARSVEPVERLRQHRIVSYRIVPRQNFFRLLQLLSFFFLTSIPYLNPRESSYTK